MYNNEMIDATQNYLEKWRTHLENQTNSDHSIDGPHLLRKIFKSLNRQESYELFYKWKSNTKKE